MSARGEGTIEVDGREVRILFTNHTLGSAERDLNKGIIDVAQSFEGGGSIGDVAVLLRHGMEAARRDAHAGGRPVTMRDAYEVMDGAGFGVVAPVVMEALAAVLGYSPEDNVVAQNGDPDGPNG